ncbi:sulfotransferase [Myxococcota bacterium]|nr:sulfotransferase [Myxococcota bacterium]
MQSIGSDRKMPVILYIIGVGHSGSTLLDLLVGAHSRAFSVGELIALSSTGKPGRQARILADPCSCGAPTKLDCSFWSEVDRRLATQRATSLGEIDLETLDPDAFRAVNQSLYDTIEAVSGRSLVVESSKRLSRFERLVEAGFDVRPIHLLREPHGVIASTLRKGHDWRRECRRYSRQAIRTRRFLTGREHMLIRYESLASEPETTVASIMDWLGLEFEPAQMRWNHARPHHIAGNRMRFSNDPTIRPDQRWKRELSRRQRWLISLYTLSARMRVRGSGVLGGAR